MTDSVRVKNVTKLAKVTTRMPIWKSISVLEQVRNLEWPDGKTQFSLLLNNPLYYL